MTRQERRAEMQVAGKRTLADDLTADLPGCEDYSVTILIRAP
jgi:hypothetical protein